MLESWQYRDPALVAETYQRQDIRERLGCAACRHRGQRLLGRYSCGIGQKAGPRGFCKRWAPLRP